MGPSWCIFINGSEIVTTLNLSTAAKNCTGDSVIEQRGTS